MAASRILIVDDEPLNLDYLQQELEGAEYETLAASSGGQALERIASEPPDLILLDIMMPGMDGFEVLRRLKADAATRSLPVIIISAASDVNSMVRGIQLGAEDYLPKPFEPTLLRARITSSLEKKRLHDMEQTYLKGLERELDIAREIQEGFLPAELPKVEGWELGAYFRAAREVAGDFYDAFLLPDGQLVFLVGDVCGKGVGAALFMTLFRSLLRAPFTSDLGRRPDGAPNISPSERLQQVISFTSNYVADTHAEANMFATVFMGLFDPGDRHTHIRQLRQRASTAPEPRLRDTTWPHGPGDRHHPKSALRRHADQPAQGRPAGGFHRRHPGCHQFTERDLRPGKTLHRQLARPPPPPQP